MSISKRLLTIVISLLFCLGLISGCTDDKSAVSTLRLGTHTWMGYEPLHLARSLGHLDEQVKLVEFASASNVIRAFKNGSIEAATLTLDEAMGLKHSGLDLVIVLVNDFSAGGDAILLRPALASSQSLKGLRIGVEGGAVGGYMLSRALEKEGLTVSDVIPVQLKPSELSRPLFAGEVDGVVSFEPHRSRLLNDGAVEYFDSRQIAREIVDVTVVSRSYLGSHPKVIGKLRDSWYEALEFMQSQPHLAHGRIGERLKMSGEEVRHSLALLEQPGREAVETMMQPGGELRVNASRLMTFMREQKLLRGSINIDSMFP